MRARVLTHPSVGAGPTFPEIDIGTKETRAGGSKRAPVRAGVIAALPQRRPLGERVGKKDRGQPRFHEPFALLRSMGAFGAMLRATARTSSSRDGLGDALHEHAAVDLSRTYQNKERGLRRFQETFARPGR
jgi:hypothetical protein